MPNIKSAKKLAKQSEVQRTRNLARKTAVKTAIKKVLVALEQGKKDDAVIVLLRNAESQLSRAKGKGVLHKNTVSRKIGRLAKKVAAAKKTAK